MDLRGECSRLLAQEHLVCRSWVRADRVILGARGALLDWLGFSRVDLDMFCHFDQLFVLIRLLLLDKLSDNLGTTDTAQDGICSFVYLFL